MIRTDLAIEAKEMYHESAGSVTEIDGVKAVTHHKDNLIVTTVEILNQNGKKALGKEIGTYITIEIPKFKEFGHAFYELGSLELKEQILKLIKPDQNDEILVVGLGNRSITPDALGAMVTDRLIITRHLHRTVPQVTEKLGDVSGISPGVMGMTGIETAEIIKGIADRTHPKAIICIDSLAARNADRISAAIQLSNTGIRPGSGIGNCREALSEETLGIPVIAIGVPMVVDAVTLAMDVIKQTEHDATDMHSIQRLRQSVSKSIGNLVVTPKDIDKLVVQMANIIAAGLNLAFHSISFDEIESYIG